MNITHLNLPTDDLELFQYYYSGEPFKVLTNGIRYRCSDMDRERQKAKNIINDHSLDLILHADASLIQMRMFDIKKP